MKDEGDYVGGRKCQKQKRVAREQGQDRQYVASPLWMLSVGSESPQGRGEGRAGNGGGAEIQTHMWKVSQYCYFACWLIKKETNRNLTC